MKIFLDSLKWTATGVLVIGFGLASAGVFYGIFIQIFGGILWLLAAVIMRDFALVTTNLIMTIAGIAGLAWKFL